MISSTQIDRARTLRALHTSGALLVLPNVWNPIGARVLETCGYPAIATASAAIAESLGYADGENLKLDTMLDLLSRIARSVSAPVTADIEAGYAPTTAALQETIARVIETGVVGINIEDSFVEGRLLRTPADQCERIAAIRGVAATCGVPLVINARVDSFIRDGFGSTEERIDEAVERARLYVTAGADCIYPIGPGDLATLTALRERISAPLNILASPNAISLAEMQRLGINRVSFGAYVFRACLAKFAGIAETLKGHGPYDGLAEHTLTGAEVRKFLIDGKES